MKKCNNIFTFIILVSFLMYVTGCGKKSDKIEVQPENLIEEAEMVEILTDMQLMEAIFRKNQFAKYDTTEIKAYYARIFSKYRIDQAGFNESFFFYKKNPRKMERIYELVIEELSMMEAQVKETE